MIWLYGRKFWIGFFAGSSAFVASVFGVWVVARTAAETATIVAGIVQGYFVAAGVIAGGYYASNAFIEAKGIANGNTHTASARQSGIHGAIDA